MYHQKPENFQKEPAGLDIREAFALELLARQRGASSVPLTRSTPPSPWGERPEEKPASTPAKPDIKPSRKSLAKAKGKPKARKGIIHRMRRFTRNMLLSATGLYGASLGGYHYLIAPANPTGDVSINVNCSIETTKGKLSESFNVVYSRADRKIISTKANGIFKGDELPQDAVKSCISQIEARKFPLKNFTITFDDGLFGMILKNSHDGPMYYISSHSEVKKYTDGVAENFESRTGYRAPNLMEQGAAYLMKQAGLQQEVDRMRDVFNVLYPWNNAPTVLPGASCTIRTYTQGDIGFVSKELEKPPIAGQMVPTVEWTAGDTLRRCADTLEQQAAQGTEIFFVQYDVLANVLQDHAFSRMGDIRVLAKSDPRLVKEAVNQLRYTADITDNYYNQNNGYIGLATVAFKDAWLRTKQMGTEAWEKVTSEPLVTFRYENNTPKADRLHGTNSSISPL